MLMHNFKIPIRRKAEVMLSYGLFSLLTERLMLHSSQFTMTTYNVLFEVSLPMFTRPAYAYRAEMIFIHNNAESHQHLYISVYTDFVPY